MHQTLKTILVDAAAVSAALTLGIGIAVAVEPEQDTAGTLATEQVAEQTTTRPQSNSERRWARQGKRHNPGEYTVERAMSTDEDRISMEDALARLREEGYTEIREIEKEKGGYEAEVRDADGRRSEVFVDGRSGRVYADKKDRDDDRKGRKRKDDDHDDHKDDPKHN